ncbi:NagC family transcriptional regulator [Microbacterium barkeri]|uniref:NagC family transcriptional regulator n=1 Tax=Microbacterium barkeri TaxID=33917 RepID=A0A9W6H557_9MICO|nr:ROK family transcriptional regulator [Microbacterium barkeri]MDR6876856.1 putative NBD/HSP70 family sugar kinase [Microbacterium barkeri]GLJ62837.1 NagC family transcriptional regulator [Microbacterium barkeri]
MSEPQTVPAPRRAVRAKVLPEHARAHNRALVLQALFHEGAMSRADLARATGLTRVTTSDLAGELIGEGVVVEQGVQTRTGPGKPATLVDIDREGLQIVAIDLSAADEYRGALLDLTGAVVARAAVPRPADGEADAARATVLELASAVAREATSRLLGVGVGAPGVITSDGVVLTAPNVGWAGMPLRALLGEELGIPVVVANDANAAALAEYTLGGASDDLMLVRIGRGVGSGLLVRGELTRGSRDAAGEIGHVTVGTDGGPRCACGRDGCLEAWLAVPALQARIAEGDRDSVLRDAGERLGIALAPVVGTLDIDDIVLSGPADLLDGPLRDAAVETLRARTLEPFTTHARVRLSAQGDDVVLRGAFAMVLDARLGIR